MDNSKSISLVISSYFYGHLAGHAIDSVISQTRKADKIYFVDDGAGDCKHLKEIYPEVEYVFRKQNMGTVDNFQDMLNRVDTDYVMFLGADNWLRPDTLEILEKNLNDITMYDILVTGEFKDKWCGDYGIGTPTKGGYQYWGRQGGHHGSMLYNTVKAKEVGGYCDGYGGKTLEDQMLFNRMVKNGANITHVPEALLYYRRHRENFNDVK